MSIAVTIADAEPSRLLLAGAWTIESAVEAKPLLRQALSNPAIRICDLSMVSDIDTAGVQLLLMCWREAQLRDVELQFADHSDAVANAVRLLRLSDVLGPLPVAGGRGRQ